MPALQPDRSPVAQADTSGSGSVTFRTNTPPASTQRDRQASEQKRNTARLGDRLRRPAGEAIQAGHRQLVFPLRDTDVRREKILGQQGVPDITWLFQ